MLEYIKGGGRRGLARFRARNVAISMRCEDPSRPVDRLVAEAAQRCAGIESRLECDRIGAVVRGDQSEAASVVF